MNSGGSRVRTPGLRRTVLVVSDTYSLYHHEMVSCLKQRLQPEGFGILCVTGGTVDTLFESESDQGVNGIYQMASRMDVAGTIILAGTFVHSVDPKIAEDFVGQFSHRPVVSIGAVSDVCSSVVLDNRPAMRELVGHVATDPANQNIVFLRGFNGNRDSEEREAAFRDVIIERGGEVDESLILTGHFLASDAYVALGRLLAERKDIHGVVAANDYMARGAIAALSQHGFRIPEDVRVSGFDGSKAASRGVTPISTVRVACQTQMDAAVNVLLDKLSNTEDSIKQCVRVPCTVLLNESTGHSVEQVSGDSFSAVPNTSSIQESLGIPDYMACHELVERALIRMARCTSREAIFDTFDDAMHSMDIQRAFIVTGAAAGEDQVERLRLMHAWPRRDIDSKESYVAEHVLPESLQHELCSGSLVATSAATHGRLKGAMIFDPHGQTRTSLDGIAQSLFGALEHLGHRYKLENQARDLELQAKRLESANAELVRMANFDALTGLPNRTRLLDELESAVQLDPDRLSVLYFDLDGFKFVNDSMGHDAGDQLLRIVSARVRSCLREGDTVGRLGGDEFAMIVRDMPTQDAVSEFAAMVLAKVSEPVSLCRGQIANVSASIGIAGLPAIGVDAEALLKQSDTAMYEAKRSGRARCVWYCSSLDRAAKESRRLDLAMREGLDAGEFSLAFQPRVNLESEKVVSVEALLRWTTRDGEQISPSAFIPIAVKTGFVVNLDVFALNAACEQVADWRARGINCSVSVNLSVQRLQQDDIVEQIAQTLAHYGVPRGGIELELTENAAMSDVDKTIEKLKAFHDMGLKLSIDDFGTAYSSLSYLKNLPIDSLKVDRSFMSSLLHVKDELNSDARIVRAVIALGNSLGLRVVGEGVENDVQRRFLKKLGCDEAQGFLFGRPVPAEFLEERLRSDSCVDYAQLYFARRAG